jgi:hypothetical protein
MRGDHGRGCRCGKVGPAEIQAGGDPGRARQGSDADGREVARENRRGTPAPVESLEKVFITVVRSQLPQPRTPRPRRRGSSPISRSPAAIRASPVLRDMCHGDCTLSIGATDRRRLDPHGRRRGAAGERGPAEAGRRVTLSARREPPRRGDGAALRAWSARARRRGPAATAPAAPAPRAASRVGQTSSLRRSSALPPVFGGPGEDGRGLWGYGRWTSEQEEADGTE